MSEQLRGSIFESHSFNTLQNDLCLWKSDVDLRNLTDDKTIVSISNNLEGVKLLDLESDHAIEWFKNNSMIAKPRKFETII